MDLAEFGHIDYLSSVDQLGFAPDGSVDLLYASHVLEHFGRHEILKVLREWYRVLRFEGVLRVAVPDFGAVAQRYVRSNQIEELVGLVCGGQRDARDYHKMIFDERSLSGLLRDIGFRSVHRYDWRSTEHVGVDDYSQAYLPHMDKVCGQLMSLNLEAIK